MIMVFVFKGTALKVGNLWDCSKMRKIQGTTNPRAGAYMQVRERPRM